LCGFSRPDFNGRWFDAAYEMMHFRVDRYNGTANQALLDGSVRTVRLWPEWMGKYKDY
jgi:prepilin-type processing-associated H-X9-DG protein